MIHCYLFEAKSIQAYLFGSGRLRDIISASERLDKLIDASQDSLLYQCLENLHQDYGWTHDLTDSPKPTQNSDTARDICFLRCKGGAFYAYSEQREPLLVLRALWTLLVPQAFPSLSFTDALVTAPGLEAALTLAFKEMGAAYNTPQVRAYRASAIMRRHPRSGQPAELPTSAAKKSNRTDQVDGIEVVDPDSNMHRQADWYWDIRKGDQSDLQQRFTPTELQGQCQYVLDLDQDYHDKDIALVHVDGNGLGVLLQQLKQALTGEQPAVYRHYFRLFSDALAKATQGAAQYATGQLATRMGMTQGTLPMRPIVLGGDDVTLLCDARHALRYAEDFIHAFESQTQQELEPLVGFISEKSERGAKVPAYLTASGGVVFHKAHHPYLQTNALVESLADTAKSLGRAASHVSFCRVSNTVADGLSHYEARTQHYPLANGKDFVSAQPGYAVQEGTSDAPSLQALRNLVSDCRAEHAPVSTRRWRQMLTELAHGDLEKADRIFRRGIELAAKGGGGKYTNITEALIESLQGVMVAEEAASPGSEKGGETVSGQRASRQQNWYWEHGSKLHCPITDLLVLEKYEFEEAFQVPVQQEGSA